MKINSKKIEELIEKSSNVIIVSHQNLDLDALGSCFAMNYVCSALNKNSIILIDDIEFESGVKRAIKKSTDLDLKIEIKNFKEIKKIINKKTLLIILDTNKKERIQNEKIFSLIKNKIIIDHHIKQKSEDKTDYEYINTDESSTCEIVMDIVMDLNIYIPPYVATVMLSGIVIDTNNFYIKSTENTHEAAALLKKFKSDTYEMQYLLKQDYKRYVERQKLILNIKFITPKIAITIGEEKIYKKEDLAKTADTILLFKNVEASFVIAKTNEDEISISARSLGSVDVQILMKKLNGGGHKTDAAAQIKGKTLKEVQEQLEKMILE